MVAEYAYAFSFEGAEYRLERLLLSEARAMQKLTGKTIREFDEALAAGDADCLAALVWVARRRTDPSLRFEDVDGDLMTFKPLLPATPDTPPAETAPAAADPTATGVDAAGNGHQPAGTLPPAVPLP